MREGTRGSTGKSSELLWETLEKTIRGKVQEFIQEILEEEVTDFLGGRRKSQRKSSAEGETKGYRNGYGKPRNLTLASGTVEVRRPREKWIAEHAEWECRSLAGREIVYAWARRDLREGRPREGQGGPAGHHRSHGGRHQGSPRRGFGLPGVRRVVGRRAARPQGPGARRAEAAGGRWQPGHPGGGAAGVARGGGAAVLEPQDGQRARPSAEAGAEAGEGAAAGGRVRGVGGVRPKRLASASRTATAATTPRLPRPWRTTGTG